MSAVIVNGTAIECAPNGNKRDRLDGADRDRALDQTYKVTVSGNTKHEWHFITPPVPRATGDAYEAVLSVIPAQACSGDFLGGAVSCFTEITNWTPVFAQGGHYVIIEFTLHEA